MEPGPKARSAEKLSVACLVGCLVREVRPSVPLSLRPCALLARSLYLSFSRVVVKSLWPFSLSLSDSISLSLSLSRAYCLWWLADFRSFGSKMQRSSRCDSKQRSKKLSVCICTKPRPRRERTEGTDAGVNSSQEPLCLQSCCNLPLLGSRLPPDKTPWCLVGNGGTDPYSSPYIPQ